MTAPLLRTRASLAREVTDLREQLAAAHERLRVDPLTGALNREGLAAAYEDARWGALLLIDLDGFKPVNDRYGHAAGDEVLRVIAARLVRPGRAVARLGGDEYAVLLPSADELRPGIRARVLADLVAEAVWIAGGRCVRVTASVGVRELRPGDQLAEVLVDADVAMYCAKHGRAVVIHTPGMQRPQCPPGVRARDTRRDEARPDTTCPFCGEHATEAHRCPELAEALTEAAAAPEINIPWEGAA